MTTPLEAFSTAPNNTQWRGTASNIRYVITKIGPNSFEVTDAASAIKKVVFRGTIVTTVNWFNTTGQRSINAASNPRFTINASSQSISNIVTPLRANIPKTVNISTTRENLTAQQAFSTAPQGTQWTGTAYGKTYYIRKISGTIFEVRESGVTGPPVIRGNLSAALNWYNTSGQKQINTANRPQYNIASTAPISNNRNIASAPTPNRPQQSPLVVSAATITANIPRPTTTALTNAIPTTINRPITIPININSDDWRVRLSLSPDANYMYRTNSPGILAPLKQTDGVIFPYTPQISAVYSASYEQTNIVHSNYIMHQYTRSSVDQISISCDFTAQDTHEANYLLAVIHFFKSMTKMFYGQDSSPQRGTPPPLCFMYGLGGFQFDNHPLAITGFTYTLPNDVDYIKANLGLSSTVRNGAVSPTPTSARLPDTIRVGGTSAPANFQNTTDTSEPTYVPTKIQISISCIPIMSRNAVSNNFSLKDYASGKLLQGRKNQFGGMW
jgi:hypothetical protein